MLFCRLQDPKQAHAANMGIVNMVLLPVEMICMCALFVSELCNAMLGAAPFIVIDGAIDATFACVLSSFYFYAFNFNPSL